MQERDIATADVKNCIMSGEIIEEYPDDFPVPSALVFGYCVKGTVLHTVCGTDGQFIYEECVQCGEKYYSDETAEHLERLVNEAKKIMQEISVIDYRKVA